MQIVTELIELLKKLRDPSSGCPWDIKQTHDSLAMYMVEEAWEVVSAIRNKTGNLVEELGDVLMNILFHCQIASERGEFDFGTVCDHLKQKIIRKHPHVFGENKGAKLTEEDVLKNWEKTNQMDKPGSRFDSVSKSMPSTVRAKIASERAKRLGIFFNNEQEVWRKVEEELQELNLASSPKEFENEIGDLLFSIVELCRFKNVDAEEALNGAVDKFIERVKTALDMCENNPELLNSSRIWDQVKQR